MSTYNYKRVEEIANEKLRKDTGIDDIEPLESYEMQLYFILLNAVEDINQYKFYLHDDVVDEIICQDPDLSQMSNYEFDTDEVLEQAKMEGIIGGFVNLSNDLYLIKEE